jgi:hypothetical protein
MSEKEEKKERRVKKRKEEVRLLVLQKSLMTGQEPGR